MKKIALVTLALLTQFGIEAKVAAKFESISGLVQYREAKGKWQPAKIGSPLSTNTELQTGPNGKAILIFPTGSKVTLGHGTLASLDSFGTGAYGSQTNMSLRMGRMNADIAKVNDANQRNHFRVRTPTVVAGVRGTIQEIGHTPDKGTEVILIQSDSEIVNANGQQSVVTQGGVSKITLTKTETADQTQNKSQTVVPVSGEAATAGEFEMAFTAGDITFSSNFSDFEDLFDLAELFDELEDEDFLDALFSVEFEKL